MSRFGTGYIVTIVVEEESKTTFDRISAFAEEHISNIKKGEAHGRQLEIILPKEEQSKFPKFLGELELNQADLKITSFGLSLNTLEQVFRTNTFYLIVSLGFSKCRRTGQP